MNEPTQEQIERFWRWCGFKMGVAGSFVYGWYKTPDEELQEGLPPIDLNNLFKWAVPKLIFVEIVFYCDGGGVGYYARLNDDAGNLRGHSLEWYPTPALALFWAIWKVIDKEEI